MSHYATSMLSCLVPAGVCGCCNGPTASLRARLPGARALRAAHPPVRSVQRTSTASSRSRRAHPRHRPDSGESPAPAGFLPRSAARRVPNGARARKRDAHAPSDGAEESGRPRLARGGTRGPRGTLSVCVSLWRVWVGWVPLERSSSTARAPQGTAGSAAPHSATPRLAPWAAPRGRTSTEPRRPASYIARLILGDASAAPIRAGGAPCCRARRVAPPTNSHVAQAAEIAKSRGDTPPRSAALPEIP